MFVPAKYLGFKAVGSYAGNAGEGCSCNGRLPAADRGCPNDARRPQGHVRFGKRRRVVFRQGWAGPLDSYAYLY